MTMNTKEAIACAGFVPEGLIDAAITQLRSTRLVNANLLDAVRRAEPILKEFAVLAIMSQLQNIAADVLDIIEAEYPIPTQGRTESWKH
jgi:hypothetical protein